VDVTAGEASSSQRLTPLAKKVVAFSPEAARAELMAPLSAEDARKLAERARTKGESLVAAHEDDATRVGKENTWKRSTEAASRRAHAGKRLSLGRRLVKLAELLEGGYQPDGFDEAIVASEGNRDFARDIWEQRRDLGDAMKGQSKSRGGDHDRSWTWKHEPAAFISGSYDKDSVKLARALKKYGRPVEHGWDVLPSPAAVEAISSAIRGDKKLDGYRVGDDLKRLRSRLALGFFEWYDHKRIAERFGLFLEMTGKDAAPRSKWQRPDRSGARDAYAQRMARAQRDQAKRWRDPGHKGIPGFFPTPAPVVERMIELAQIEPGMSVLEPSAGTGDIADRLPGDAQISVAEHNYQLRQILEAKGYQPLPDALEVPGRFDRIVMNPPFEDNADIRHVMHAFEHNLAPSGRLVAIVSASALGSSRKINDQFRAFVDEYRAEEDYRIPNELWKRSGTAVSADLIVLGKSR
jgi:hypothetical protein